MSTDVLLENVDNHLKAIDLCLEHHLGTQALILIYTGVDIMASISRSAFTKKTGKRQFIAWAENYMNCQSRIGVSGVDLYAARCAIVHTATADSSLSDDGNARRFCYVWGDRHTNEPMALLQKPGHTDVVVRVEDLADALRAGITSFRDGMIRNPDVAALVKQRSGKLVRERSGFPGVP